MTYDTPADVDNADTGAGTGMAPAERIRELNDKLRKTGIGGKTYLTRGIIDKGADFMAKASASVRDFDAFTDDNDPWQEHDFASLEVDGETVMFKIDYYDVNMEYGSPDPSDPAVTERVMTIMLAGDY
jgi:hypothetical protein